MQASTFDAVTDDTNASYRGMHAGWLVEGVGAQSNQIRSKNNGTEHKRAYGSGWLVWIQMISPYVHTCFIGPVPYGGGCSNLARYFFFFFFPRRGGPRGQGGFSKNTGKRSALVVGSEIGTEEVVGAKMEYRCVVRTVPYRTVSEWKRGTLFSSRLKPWMG